MDDEQLKREEEERYEQIDRIIDKADADSDDPSEDPDPEQRAGKDPPRSR